MTPSCILGSVRVEKNRKSELLCFHPICLKFGTESNFKMLLTNRRPELKLEIDLSKKLQFSTDHGNSGCPMGLVCIVKVTKIELPTALPFYRTSLSAVHHLMII